MTLEDLIHQRLTECGELASQVAVFSDQPAIFQAAAPNDHSPGWGKRSQYPRIDFTVDLESNPERQTSGLLSLNIWCDDQGAMPQEIEPVVRAALCNIFIQPDGPAPPYSLAWLRSEVFESKNNVKPETLIIGMTVLFDIYAFPCNESVDPDPVLAMNNDLSHMIPYAMIIGRDPIQEFFAPTDLQPAIYFRLVRSQTARETNTVVWVDAVLAGHIFAPSVDSRLKWLRYIAGNLSERGEVTMPDNSPMFLSSITLDNTADPLSAGQLRLQVRFGILRRFPYAPPMQINMEGFQR